MSRDNIWFHTSIFLVRNADELQITEFLVFPQKWQRPIDILKKEAKISSISRKIFAESFGMNLPSDGSPQVLAFSASFCVTKQNFQFRFRLCFEGQLFQLDPIFCGARAKELAGVHEKCFEIKSSMVETDQMM